MNITGQIANASVNSNMQATLMSELVVFLATTLQTAVTLITIHLRTGIEQYMFALAVVPFTIIIDVMPIL